jgi:site-specific DNA recombinase
MALQRRRRTWPGDEPGQSFQGSIKGMPAAVYCRVSNNPDKTETRSVDQQRAEALEWAERAGVALTDADIYADDNFSASRYAVKDRESFGRLREAVNAGKYKIVWFWATSRQTRGDIPLSELAAEYEQHGVLWCFSGSLYNPANDDDSMILEIHHVIDKKYSAQLSRHVRRGMKHHAENGNPPVCPVYGYRRRYDPLTRKFARDEPDEAAKIVREIYDRIEHGDSVNSIRRDLEARGVPSPRKHKGHRDPAGNYLWSDRSIRSIASNPFYIGKRVFHRESTRDDDRLAAILDHVTEVAWDPIITEEQFWTVQRVLSDPARIRNRLPAGAYTQRDHRLLTSITRCAVCAAPLSRNHVGGVAHLKCRRLGCVSIREDWLDAYVEDVMVSWATREDVYTWLWRSRERDSATAAAARGEAERLKLEIDKCRAMGEDPDADAVFLQRRIRALKDRLAEAETVGQPAPLSKLLAGFVGPDAADRWVEIPTAVRRRIIAMAADIRVARGRPGGGRAKRFNPGRVQWTWLLGPDSAAKVQ